MKQILRWEYGANEPCLAWRFADLGERDVWAAWSEAGHGARGLPWGLVYSDNDYFSSDFSWYSTLGELFEEWFI